MTAQRDRNDWRANLVGALERLDQVERHYLSEIHETQLQRELSDARFPIPFPVSDPARDRLSFYRHVWRSKGIYAERRYSPLRTVLENAAHQVGQHSALAPVLEEDGRGYEFSFRILTQPQPTSCLSVVAGLVSRAQQVGQSGFGVASTELESLLDSARDDASPGSSELTVAYHVSLFHGLQFSEDLHVADDLVAAPLKRIEPFVNKGVLEEVAPEFARGFGHEAVGAMLSPIPWRLTLGPHDEERDLPLDWGGSFFADARTFIQLLAIAHGVPVVPLTEIGYCVHRTALHLLGQPHYHSSTIPTAWKLSFGRLPRPSEIDDEAFGEAKGILLALEDRHPGDLEPVVTRLAQAVARSGQYAAADRILDLAIALEQMYRQGWTGSQTLAARAAWFLGSDGKTRRRVFDDVRQFYKTRSDIIHARNTPSAKRAEEASNSGFDVARRSVFKLLRQGQPSDWTGIVLGSEC
ncbi:MAG: hypothetical protein OXH49_08520 [Gemmatimonadetes bacterium]|nr:hypothetical protein [Gemmatimonadota bacterium]